MLVARICQVSFAPVLKAAPTRFQLIRPSGPKSIFRTFADESRNSFQERLARRRTLRERAMAPAGETAFDIGKGALAGGSALGLGALCYYGLGLSKQAGIADQYALWPDYVKKRVHATYMYFGGSLVITAAAAAATLRSPTLMNLMTRSSFLEGFGAKQLAWIVHASILGAVVAPVCLMGGPVVTKAAWYTLGIVGGLSTIAVCAPSGKFLTMAGPLAIGLGTVFIASIGSFFLPPTSVLGAGLYSLSVYGGLLLFSGFLLYDTHRIVHVAENYPAMMNPPYDPINACLSIYLDVVNIFIRMVMILGGGGNRKK
ncbi:Bax inhibitor 1 [Gryllus bimaculatus]|nr:Bax inhibitor 1 [Gryllus bimaculatus]